MYDEIRTLSAGVFALDPQKDDGWDEMVVAWEGKYGLPKQVKQAMKMPGNKESFSINQNGLVTMVGVSPYNSKAKSFMLNVSFTEQDFFGSQVKAVFSTEGTNVLLERVYRPNNQTRQEELAFEIRRHFGKESMTKEIIAIELGSIKAKRYYIKLSST